MQRKQELQTQTMAEPINETPQRTNVLDGNELLKVREHVNESKEILDNLFRQNSDPKHLSSSVSPRPQMSDNDTLQSVKTYSENHFIQEKYPRKITYEGRILELDQNVMEEILSFCPEGKKYTFSGSFGKVRTSKCEVPCIGIKVAVKIIKCAQDEDQLKRSVVNEKLASRIMHFAIVPILAMAVYTENGRASTYCLLSPLLENGDLFQMIEKDTKSVEKHSQEVLTVNMRLRILYHLSSAIEFLHRDIPKLRGPIIHLDVKTRNIVLDKFYNARLVDFGVARELAENKDSLETKFDTQIPITSGYYEPPITGVYKKSFDISNIGIVIRELLSGKPPKSGNKELKHIKTKTVFRKNYLQKQIWIKDERKESEHVYDKLFTLSAKCLEKRKEGARKEDTSAREIVNQIEELMKVCKAEKWDRSDVASDCEICMVNPSADDTILEHNSCTCKMKVCIPCMRNEYLNPIICHTCNENGKPLRPAIGGNEWGAVLIAGNDEADPAFSSRFLKDVEKIREVLTSKFPLVVGMSAENVKVVEPAQQSCPGGKDPLCLAFDDLDKPDIHTIFIYFSGHYCKEKGFRLKNNATLTKNAFKHKIETFARKKNSLRFIIILDCCVGPGIASDSLDLKPNTCVVQLNACRSNQEAEDFRYTGGIFTQLFIQGFTKKAKKEKCYIEIKTKKTCRVCCDGIEGKGFVTILNMQRYIQDHLEQIPKTNGHTLTNPTIYATDMAADDARIGYLIDSCVEISFRLEYENREKGCTIGHKFYDNMTELKKTLFDNFMKEMNLNETQPELKSDDYHDICCTEIQIGPTGKHRQEIETVEQLVSALNARRFFVVSLRDISMIRRGMIGVFVDADGPQKLIKNKQYKLTKPPGRTVVHLSYEDLNNIIDDTKTVGDNSETGSENGQQESCGIVNDQTEEIDMAVEYEEHAGTSKRSDGTSSKTVVDFNKTLADLMECLDEDEHLNKEQIEIQLIFPCIEDETGKRTHRPDFVCFRLIPDGENHPEAPAAGM